MLNNVYSSEARFLEHLQTQKQNIAAFAAEVGATPADEAAIAADAAAIAQLIALANLADDWKKTITGVKARVLSSKPDPPAGTIQAAPPIAALTQPVEANAIGRSRERDQRFLHANPPPSQACLEALDLIGEESQGLTPGDVKPTIRVSPAASGYLFSIVVGGRGDATSWEVSVRGKDGVWHQAGTFTGKSADVVFEPTPSGDPLLLDIRVQLKKSNENYGQVSDIVQTTLNP